MDERVGVVRVPFSPDDLEAYSEHLGIAVRCDDTVVFEHDADTEMVHDAGIGAFAGVPIGAIAGIALAALAVSGIGVIGMGGTLAIAGVSALWGGLRGAYTGVAVSEAGGQTHEDLSYTALQKGEVMAVVCSHGHGDAVRDVMQCHDGRLHAVEPHAG